MKKILICSTKEWFKPSEDLRGCADICVFDKKEQLSKASVDSFGPDLIFFPHWNWYIEEPIFMEYRCVVFHTAPLPFGRGGSPIQNLIKLGYDSAPVSALKVTHELDGGPIYCSEKVDLSGALWEIQMRLSSIINKMIKNIVFTDLVPTAQVGKPHYFARLTYQDNEIVDAMELPQIYDSIRMIDGSGYKPAYIRLDSLLLELTDAQMEGDELTCKATIKKVLHD
ncbi:hypothetical protein N9X60_03035 [Paracoccaceae bacterium]|nr:hypothetical protein [Paracoccaceae bacterium]